MDDRTKFKTCVAMAKTQNSITEDAILATFDTLKATLVQQDESFKTHAAAFTAKEVTSRQNRLAEISNQIAALQAEQVQVSNDLADKQATASHIQSAFTLALQRRGAEIDQQKAQIAGMLKG